MLHWIREAKRRTLILLTAGLFLAGCQEVLYSDLTEADANEMVALLVLSGIPASRERDKTLKYSVMVEEDDLAVAVTVLKNSGLPREKFASLGEVFGDTGVVSTPFEERIRFAYATNEELSHTISEIKGVDRARVHVVIPAEERFGKTTEPARASIVVFHDASFEPAAYSGRIKALVAYAVPGLEVEAISTTYFLSPGFVVQPAEETAGAGSVTAAGSTSRAVALQPRVAQLPVMEIALFLVLVALVRIGMLVWKRPGSTALTVGNGLRASSAAPAPTMRVRRD